jgi:hypothetical protein
MDANVIKKIKNTYRCYSVAFPVFNNIYDTFYQDGKKVITKATLDILTATAWMRLVCRCRAKEQSEKLI